MRFKMSSEKKKQFMANNTISCMIFSAIYKWQFSQTDHQINIYNVS